MTPRKRLTRKLIRQVRKTITFMVLVCSVVLVQSQNLEVTLLGTGTPSPSVNRFGPSILVKAGIERFLFDCGRGTTQRLFQTEVPECAIFHPLTFRPCRGVS